jgi:hypothetical protein
MSTKIGIIAEGSIDHALLPALLTRIAQDKAGYRWPLDPVDVAELFPFRKRGHGGVLDAVKRLVRMLNTEYFDHACFVIVLDRRTRAVQRKIRRLIAGKERFVLGIAIEEIEAWWLGDRTNTLAWTGFSPNLPGDCHYAQSDYHAEKDRDPKRTLDELTRRSDRFDRCYGEGNVEMAREFADNHWRDNARLNEIEGQCPLGFVPFQEEMTTQFQRAKGRRGRLFE